MTFVMIDPDFRQVPLPLEMRFCFDRRAKSRGL
jgi:hypothetical protein